MVPTNGHRQLTLLRVSTNDVRNRFAYLGDQTWVLQDPDWRIVQRVHFFELVVSVELDDPA